MKEKGFTLIELVVVIVILGILAATALPRFMDLAGDARTAAIQGAASALTSQSSMNYSTSLIRGATGTGLVRLSAAGAGGSLIAAGMGGWDAAKYVLATGSDLSCNGSTAGASGLATLNYATAQGGTTANTATATIICTG